MRIPAGTVIAFTAFAVSLWAEESKQAAAIVRHVNLPNPVADPVTLGNRLALVGEAKELPRLDGVISVRFPGPELGICWDPVECRWLFAWRGSEVMTPESKLVFIAAGPGPAAITIGAYGPPVYFGYRLTDGGVPEFLYTQGRLGIEERIQPGKDGKSLEQRFRIENASYGVLLSIPPAWKDHVKSSSGKWENDLLSISGDAARAGFTLTYDLSQPPDLPEFPSTWTLFEDAGPSDPDNAAPPLPAVVANQGYQIEALTLPAPHQQSIIADLQIAPNGQALATTREGLIYLGTPGAEKWEVYTDQLGPGTSIVDASAMPDSLLIDRRGVLTRLFDTNEDGAPDFFKWIREPEEEVVSTESEDEPEEDTEIVGPPPPPPADPEPSILRIHRANGFPAALQTGNESGQFETVVWIPESLSPSPGKPIFCEPAGPASGPFADQVFIQDDAAENPLRLLRVMLDDQAECWQGAVTDFTPGILEKGGSNQSTSFSTPAGGEVLYLRPGIDSPLLKIAPGDEPAFEVSGVRLAADGFEIRFSRPVDRRIATDTSRYQVIALPVEKDGQGEIRTAQAAIVDSDGLTVGLQLPVVETGMIYRFDLSAIQPESGNPLAHGPVIYTVNEIPAAVPEKESDAEIDRESAAED